MYGGTFGQRSSNSPDIIVGTPGRLVANIKEGRLQLSSMKSLVIDEAHRMLEDNFIDDMTFIRDSIWKAAKARPQLVMLSATFPEEIKPRIDQFYASEYVNIDLVKNLADKMPKTVKHYALQLPHNSRAEVLIKLIEKYVGDKGKTLVFVNRKSDAKDLISQCKLPNARALHGDMTQEKREEVFKQFRAGKVSLLFATDVAARGLDIPLIDLVVQLEPTPDADLYVHRAGRTARAGRDGVVISVWEDSKEIESLQRIERASGTKFRKLKFDAGTQIVEETTEFVQFTDKGKEGTWRSKFTRGPSRDQRRGDRYSRGSQTDY